MLTGTGGKILGKVFRRLLFKGSLRLVSLSDLDLVLAPSMIMRFE